MLLILLLVSVTAWAQPKIAYVNFGKVADASPQISRGLARLDEEFRPRNVVLERQEETLGVLEGRLLKDGPFMAVTEAQNLERNVRALRRQLQRDREDAAEAFNFRLNEVYQEVEERIGQIVQEFGKAQGYDIIFATEVLYVSDEFEITDQVIELLRNDPGQEPRQDEKKSPQQ